jgi:hypothetical protein
MMSENVVIYSVVAEVNALRAMGINDEHIAFKLRMGEQQVRAIPLPIPAPARSRAVQHAQLMKMAQALMPKVEAGDKDAIVTMLKVMQREANLLGLDAPKEVINRNFHEGLDRPIQELTTEELLRMINEQTIDVTPGADDA